MHTLLTEMVNYIWNGDVWWIASIETPLLKYNNNAYSSFELFISACNVRKGMHEITACIAAAYIQFRMFDRKMGDGM